MKKSKRKKYSKINIFGKVKGEIFELAEKALNFDESRLIFPLVILLVSVLNIVTIYTYFFDREVEATAKVKTIEIPRNIELENKIRDMVEGYPMERMVSYIARKDEKTAAFLVSIAKKESDWGKRSPKLNGKDCYNYWGYRGKRERMGTGGHTCFDSPRDAVNTVADRIKRLSKKEIDTPKKMIVWKCGSSCEAHSDYSVQKWISDVDFYFEKIYN